METTNKDGDSGISPEELMSVEELMGAAQDPTDEILTFQRTHAAWVGKRCLEEFDELGDSPTYPIL